MCAVDLRRTFCTHACKCKALARSFSRALFCTYLSPAQPWLHLICPELQELYTLTKEKPARVASSLVIWILDPNNRALNLSVQWPRKIQPWSQELHYPNADSRIPKRKSQQGLQELHYIASRRFDLKSSPSSKCHCAICAMLCYAMPCHAMPCHAMPCHAMPCHAMPCYDMLCHAMICYAMLCYAMLCYAMLCCAMLD